MFDFPLQILIPIFVVILILITVVIILYKKNSELNLLLEKEKKRFKLYIDGITNLSNSTFQNPKEDFQNLNKYVRAFFKEYYNLDYSLTYLELYDIFTKQNKEDYAELCRMISDADYKGDKNKPEEIRYLVSKFKEILFNYKHDYKM